MRPGREIDTKISQSIMGYKVKVKAKELWEETPLGDRPLRKYSKEIAAAWEVAEKMNVTLIPISEHSWFALAGKEIRFGSPADFIKALSEQNFAQTGAGVNESPALAICEAAIMATEKRKPVDNVTPIAHH
jgi:hypothetical protein